MAVVIRLQGLPVVAGSADIRHFFAGLQIHGGGVHIVGGERGEAFIIFATDEDARRAMGRSGGFIKNSVITLYLSSKTELQNTVKINLKAERGSLHRGTGAPGSGPITNLVSEIKKGIHLSGYVGGPEVGMNKNGTRRTPLDVSKVPYGREPVDVKALSLSSVLYLNLTGMPYLITEEEVRAFFHGLHVDDILLLRHPDGRRNGNGIVKFASNKDALEGLKRNKQYIGSRYVEIIPSSEEQWARAGGLLNSQNVSRGRSRERSPAREMHAKDRSGTDSPPKKQRIHSYSPPHDEFYVHLKNLPKHTGKRPIMNFFKDLDLADTQIKVISTKHNTMDAFVVLKNEEDYNKALGFHKEMLNDQRIYIYAISKKSMLETIDEHEAFERKRSLARERTKENLVENSFNPYSGSRIFLYVRNFPFDVTALEVEKFFVGLDVHENDIQLLTDGKGVGLGEALVTFSSEEHAKNAESLNRHTFLGTEVLLQRITEKQVEEMGLRFNSDVVKDQDSRRPPFGGKDFSSVELPGGPGGPDGFRSGPEEFKTIPDEFRVIPPQKGIEDKNSFGRERMKGLPQDAKFPLDGRLPDGRFSDRFPDGRFPDRRLPDGRLPDGRFPDGRLPDGRFPDGRLPDGRFPEGRMPDGRFPEGRMPDGRFPDGRLPDGRFPDGRLPDGSFPAGRLPDGSFPAGRLPDGSFPAGRLPDGRFPEGRLPDGRFPEGRFPDGRFPEGRFPDGRLPDGRFPGARFPDGRLPDGCFPDGRLPAGRFPDGRLPDGRFLDSRLPDGMFPEGRHPGRSFPNEVTGKFAGGITKIRLNNLPYTVRIDEILDFFHGFRVVPGSVNLSYTPEGLATGIATIAVESYENAIAAISELNERPVGPRKVSLSLFNEQEIKHP